MTSTMDLADAYANETFFIGNGTSPPQKIKQLRAALEQRIKELEADAARLEHLCESVRCSSANIDGNHGWNFLHGYGWKTGATFREAVDSAMSEAALQKLVDISQEYKLP